MLFCIQERPSTSTARSREAEEGGGQRQQQWKGKKGVFPQALVTQVDKHEVRVPNMHENSGKEIEAQLENV